MHKIEFPVPLLSKANNWAWYIPPNVRTDKPLESEEEARVLWVVFGGKIPNNNEKYSYFSCVSLAKIDIIYFGIFVADSKILTLLQTRLPVVICLLSYQLCYCAIGNAMLALDWLPFIHEYIRHSVRHTDCMTCVRVCTCVGVDVLVWV